MADAERFRNFHNSHFLKFLEDGTHKILLWDGVGDRDELVGSFFQVKVGGFVKDVPRSKLIYCRQDLLELYDALLEDDEARIVYLGNPGTGKSLTAIQLLYLLLKFHKDNPTVYYSHKISKGLYYLFKEGKFHSVLDYDAVRIYLESSDTFYIHDGSAIPSSGSVGAQTILVTSPEAMRYKEFGKVSGGYTTFYGRLWELEELKMCRERAYSRLKWTSIADHVRIAGAVPRLVFQTDAKFETVSQLVRNKLSSTTDLLVVFSMIGPHDLDKTFSHILLHLDRGSKASRGYTKVASDFVKEQLLLRLDKEKWLQMIGQFSSLQGIGGLASFRGTVMELLLHMTFPKFLGDCKRICDGESSHKHTARATWKLNVDEGEDMRVVFYVDFDDLQAKVEKCMQERSLAAYFWPRMKNEAAVDSIYVDFKRGRAYLLQSTVSKRHPVIWHPVKKLMEFLITKRIRIVGLFFVVANTNFSAFKAQRWRKTRKVRGELPEAKKFQSLCQYKVQFSVSDDDWENIESLNDTLNGMDADLKSTLEREMDVPEDHVRKRRRDATSTPAPFDIDEECELDLADMDVAPSELYEQESED